MGLNFHLQLDNTTGENKNWIVITFVAWLLEMDYFSTGRIFFLLKGDTKTELDQTFGVYMRQLKNSLLLQVQ